MRIATVTFQQDATSQMQELQADLAKTQNDLATSKRLHSAADDPAAMAQVNQLNVSLSASQQYVTNGQTVSANLNLEAQAMSDATNTLQSIRDLAVEGNDASLTPAARKDIATQMTQQLQDLLSISNRQDSTGNYLFSGTASGTQPFSQSGTSFSYAGSNAVGQVQIASNQRIPAGDSGATVFMNIPAGNGTFTTAAGAANTGTGVVGVGTVVNQGSRQLQHRVHESDCIPGHRWYRHCCDHRNLYIRRCDFIQWHQRADQRDASRWRPVHRG
jgi:flagellar hook-associated protein 3 FlgL